jgi:hypothetical protein
LQFATHSVRWRAWSITSCPTARPTRCAPSGPTTRRAWPQASAACRRSPSTGGSWRPSRG